MKAEIDGQLASVLTSYEQNSTHFWGGTFRGLRHDDYQGLYYRDEARNEYNFDLVREIKQRIVGDVGSGAGGLATTAAMEEIEGEIWSIHPNMGDEEFTRWQQKTVVGELKSLYPIASAEDIEKAQKKYESRGIRGFAHNLRSVRDEFFDTLIDSYAAHKYMSREPGVYNASIHEMLRVLRRGGKIIVLGGLAPLPFMDGFPDLPVSDFRERALQRLGIPFTALYKKAPNGEKCPVGAIIQKPH